MKERFRITKLNDQICEFIWTMYPGGSVPEHYHEESDEFFQVLYGQLTFRVNGKTSVLGPGEEILVPKLALHSISNVSGPMPEPSSLSVLWPIRANFSRYAYFSRTKIQPTKTRFSKRFTSTESLGTNLSVPV